MPESKKGIFLGRMWTKEEMREWVANPDFAIGLGPALLIFGIMGNPLISLCGAIIFGGGIIAKAIMKQGK